MAKKREQESGEVNDVQADPSAPIDNPSVPTANGIATEEAPARRQKRRRQGTATERSYWVCGRAQSDDPWDRIMCFETVGRARKGLKLVRMMPHYKRHQLRLERCVVVE